MLADYNLKMPGAVYSGEHALEQMTKILKGKVKRAAVFTDPGIKKAGLLDLPLSCIAEAGTEPVIIDRIPAEPSCEQVQEAVNEFWASGADFIIAVGGGSVMDTAKLASVLDQSPDGVRKLLDNPVGARKIVKTMMIPTTAGTGSEATPNSIAAVPEKELKVGIVNEEMIADYVILDARMVKSLPRKLAAATGVDALAHAIECFTSNKANPFSDLFALEALELIFNNIEAACDDPENDKAKNAMQTAAFYAGAAITASGTTAVHALSYPLGGKYHIPHGVSNAMLLTPVMKFNEPACRNRLARAFDRIAASGRAESGLKTEEEKSAWIISRLEHIVKHLDIPVSLKEYGVGKEDLEDLVASGMEVKRLLNNNMREVKPEDARALYLQILE
ncbi:iron-containing alcohol dehydrogenase [Clostridium sp. MCC353]|uniref:iron-containing alcohol dehydrogenase n=1 Tax=Clostridium sp. MCC353 TaxID=2592646 RepID=UPI001C013AD2|nr:iron-containing alcohol dehydrogenase [Clostridium sp. MCC353]MBT9780097.1 iron-containing alcohol dehydrogenase [Clostridium sp. MCC353]